MQLDDMVLISIDDHVVEPPGVFDHHLSARWKEVAPRIVRKPSGADVWVFNGAEVPNLAINAVSGLFPEEYGLEPTAYEQIREGTYDIDERIRDMSANGVLASLCFPSFPGFSGRLFMGLDDKEAALALVRAYNDWHVEEWCGTHPGRMIPCIITPIWDPEAMATEVRRNAERGVHAVTFTENPAKLGLPSLHTDHWDPFWKACSDTATNVCLHLGSSSELVVTSPDAPIDVMIILQGINLVQAAADLTFSRIFKQFPDLQFSLTEGGIGWVPYFEERADDTWRVHHRWTGSDFGGRMPSEVFRDHVVLCFIKDPHGLKMASQIGVDRICWETDYPHSDSTWPNAPERLMSEFLAADTNDGDIDRITHGNAMRHYSFDPFAHIPRGQATVGALRAQAVDVDTSLRSSGRPIPDRHGPVTIIDVQKVATA